MALGVSLQPSRRLESLDVLRGITIASMLLVNNPGTWSAVYPPLLHADWNGWTFTDLVFPFFLFMVGMAMMYSFPKRMEAGDSSRTLFGHVVRRAFALMVLGWWGSTWSLLVWPGSESAFASGGAFGALLLRLGFAAGVLGGVVLLAGTKNARPWWIAFGAGVALFFGGSALVGFDDTLPRAIADIRIPGVLVRIGACYLLASAIWFLTPDWKSLVKWLVGLLGFYYVFMVWIPVPGFGFADLSMGFPTLETPRDQLFSNWAYFIDYHVFGTHVWSARTLFDDAGTLIWAFDPEGLISTIPAVGTVICGMLAGLWMRRTDRSDAEKLNGLFVAAAWALLAGQVMSIWMPINKNLWTSSYVIFTAGLALISLAFLFHLIDMKGYHAWARPFRSYGRNAIFAYVASGMMVGALGRLRMSDFSGDGVTSWKGWSYDALDALFGDPTFASFIWGMLFVTVWAAITWWMDDRKIYFKV